MAAHMQFGPLDQARQLAERGQYRQARAAYKKAVAARPGDASALIEFAVMEAQSGHAKSARRLLEKAQKVTPDDPSIPFNLAELARQAGALDHAVDQYRAALALTPNDADILYGLGDALRELKRMEDALPYLERAHEASPDDSEILNSLAIVLEEVGQGPRALQCYHRAITLAPNYVEAWGNYGQALYRENRLEEAVQAFQGAQKRQHGRLPTSMLAAWARALASAGRYDDAFDIAGQAMESGDDPADAHFTLGSIHLQNGDFDRAREHLTSALEFDPKAGEAYEKLARIKELTVEAVEPLRAILADDTLGASPRAGAGFALYTVLDKADRCDEAFEALKAANAHKSAALQFDPEQHARMFSRAIETFDRQFFADREGQGLDTDVPIFVLGMPRSGTTLTEQILATYAEVKPCGEQQDFQNLVASLPNYPDNLNELAPDWARDQGARILKRMVGDAPHARFATNKSPGNYAFIGLIAWIFPRSKIIYCRRDPRDIGLSSFEQNFRSGLSFTYDLEAFGFAYKQHERIMAHWSEVAPLDIHEIDYERLVTEPETVARPMVEFCGLEWTPDCLNTSGVERPIETASVWQVRQPINKGSVGKWKRYERHLEPMIKALGM